VKSPSRFYSWKANSKGRVSPALFFVDGATIAGAAELDAIRPLG